MINNAKLILRYLAVAEAGSIHAAAHILNLSQPALTKSIHSLEENLGQNCLNVIQKVYGPLQMATFLSIMQKIFAMR